MPSFITEVVGCPTSRIRNAAEVFEKIPWMKAQYFLLVSGPILLRTESLIYIDFEKAFDRQHRILFRSNIHESSSKNNEISGYYLLWFGQERNRREKIL